MTDVKPVEEKSQKVTEVVQPKSTPEMAAQLAAEKSALEIMRGEKVIELEADTPADLIRQVDRIISDANATKELTPAGSAIGTMMIATEALITLGNMPDNPEVAPAARNLGAKLVAAVPILAKEGEGISFRQLQKLKAEQRAISDATKKGDELGPEYHALGETIKKFQAGIDRTDKISSGKIYGAAYTNELKGPIVITTPDALISEMTADLDISARVRSDPSIQARRFFQITEAVLERNRNFPDDQRTQVIREAAGIMKVGFLDHQKAIAAQQQLGE